MIDRGVASLKAVERVQIPSGLSNERSCLTDPPPGVFATDSSTAAS